MITLSSLYDNDRQYTKRIKDQENLIDMISDQLAEEKNTVNIKQTEILEIKECLLEELESVKSFNLSIEELYKVRAIAEAALRERDAMIFSQCEKIRLLEVQSESFYEVYGVKESELLEKVEHMKSQVSELLEKLKISDQKMKQQIILFEKVSSSPSGNTKKDKIQQTPSSTKKNKIEAYPRTIRSSLINKNCVVKPKDNAYVQHSKLNVNSDLQCVTCNGCLFFDNHDSCVLDFVNNVNARVKSKFVKKTVKRKVWKLTGNVFTNIGYKWRPTGRTFTIVENACPLASITTTAKVPFRKPIALERNTPKHVVTLVYSRKPKASRNNAPISKFRHNKSLSANKKELNKSWGSTVSNVSSSYIDECMLSKLFSGKRKKKSYKPKSEDTNQEIVPVSEGSLKTTTEENLQPTSNYLRTSSNTSRANQDNTLRINRGTGYDNQRVVNVAGARENVAYHKDKMLLCKQEEAGFQLNTVQANWRDDTDDEPHDQELKAHYMHMEQIQEVTPDVADNSAPIFDAEPLQKVQNNNDNYNVFAIESKHHEQLESVNDTYPVEQDEHNMIIDSLDMSYDREQVDQDDDDLAKERDLLASLIEKINVECYNYHRRGYFARDCRSAKNSGNKSRDAGNARYRGRDNGKRPAKEEDENELVV
nr:hypothetical protein [Tanacetum cinerariifolium]